MSHIAYRGIHTSLYSSLPAEAIQHVEQAIWLRSVGQMKDARAVFENELKPLLDAPVLVIERADLELEAGRWGEAWRILDARLASAKEAGEDLDTAAHRLIALTRAMLGTRHRGDVVSSFSEIKRTQHWLRNLPITEYTDIHASCIRRYVLSYLFTRLQSNYENPDAEHLPTDPNGETVPASKVPWSGLGQLRRHLSSRGMFHEAAAVFRVELNRTALEQREPVVEEFLLAIETGFPSSNGKDFVEATVRLQRVDTYIELQDITHAVEEISRSEAAFNRYCDHFDVKSRDSAPHMQALEERKLSCIQDPFERLRRAEELSGRLELAGSSRTGACLSVAAELALAFHKVTSEREYLEKYFDFQSRLEKHDERVSEDIADLVLHHNALIPVTVASLVNREKLLEWIDGFLRQYPHFSAPRILASLYRSQSLLLTNLRRAEEASIAFQKAVELDSFQPWHGEWAHLRNATAAFSIDGAIGPLRPGSEANDQGEPFYWPWRSSMGDEDESKETTLKLLWTWSLDDVVTGHLSFEDFSRMTEMKTKDISSIIFIPGAEVDPLQEDGYDRICSWLMNPPQEHRNRRLFCLVMLRNARQLFFSANLLWHHRLREVKQLLEFYETLPQLIRETFPGFQGYWLGVVALSHVALLEVESDLTTRKPLEQLQEAQTYNELALAEFRRTKDRAMVALHQRVGAQICMLTISRLRQLMQLPLAGLEAIYDEAAQSSTNVKSSLTPTEVAKEIGSLRAIGLEKIKETDEILTDSELHASWSDGLNGVRHRQSITAFNTSAYTVQIAMHFLLVGEGEPSQETITSLWGWVQKYKARSLARTIGVRASDPPDLVKTILANPEARPLYEKMKQLEDRILNADLTARFDLRRELDAHTEAMKRQHPLLRQLIDLREATPFEASDIITIEKRAGAPVVLVDWFLLQPYLQGETGKLLLFTARAGFQPTMDLLTTKLQDIGTWCQRFLVPEEWKDFREENLNTIEARTAFQDMLGGLIAPLGHRTERNEVLVLCPSSVLHLLPLHALSIVTPDPEDADDSITDGLIHRNPVVYTHSHSLLRSCYSATELARHSLASMSAQFLSGISKQEIFYYDKEREIQFDYSAGRASIEELARLFKSTPLLDAGASKYSFLSVAAQSRMLHLHTHCNWNSSDPLDHHVEFPRSISPSGGRPVEALPARELFDVRLLPGTHVNMIACQGGLAEVKLGDEVMGLVPALLYAGASSTVSTLWCIKDADGAVFAKHFFHSFLQQCALGMKKSASSPVRPEENDDSLEGYPIRSITFVNLARAVRAAAIKMDKGQCQPLYRWAGYVLHGFWQFPLSGEDIKWLQG
ncbi:hypothetical protein GQ53DRAFT_861857 [Thozetella sp. PMI_491]|nr:hypothetical protein GQ53DRAFT_861857 [Thozetella sp. PMI_491]